MTYCTVTQARSAGATGTDTEVLDAIATAESLVDAYTGAIWEPRALTVVTPLEADGMAFLPYPVQSVTTVMPVGSTTVIPTAGYRVLSSLTRGQVDAVAIGAAGRADALVLGAEPWAGGWRALVGGREQVEVSGTFGPAATPVEVRDATAALAAWRTQGGMMVTAPTTPTTDDEGNVVTVKVTVEQVATRARTTGLPAVDALLAHHVHDSIRIG